MSNVVISNKNLFDQRVYNIDSNKVLLPFNVTKENVLKLSGILNKIDALFSYDVDRLSISSMKYASSSFKENDRNLENCKFTLANAYVATVKRSITDKVKKFYDRVVIPKVNVPVFEISKETNLQEALNEATQEINLTELNNALSDTKVLASERPIDNYTQVLANDATGNVTTFGGDMNAKTELNQVVTDRVSQAMVNPTPVPAQVDNNLNNSVNTSVNDSNVNVNTNNVNPIPSVNFDTINNEAVNSNVVLENEQNTLDKPKVKVRKLKGNVLVIPIVIIWLALVLVGSVKLVTSILT